MDRMRIMAKMAVTSTGNEHAQGLRGRHCRQFRFCAILSLLSFPAGKMECLEDSGVLLEEIVDALDDGCVKPRTFSSLRLSKMSECLFSYFEDVKPSSSPS